MSRQRLLTPTPDDTDVSKVINMYAGEEVGGTEGATKFLRRECV